MASDASFSLEKSPEWLELTQTGGVSLTARVNPTQARISSSGLENQLYRVEIHTGGNLNQATFKWSRDNGVVVSAIQAINAEDSTIALPRPSRDALLSFKAGQWVEVTDEVRELNNRPGTLVQLKNVVVKAGEKLFFDPTKVVGDPLNAEKFPPSNNPKVRRWDQTVAEVPIRSTSPDGIELENGISVIFGLEGTSTAKTGDYWLIPVRMNTENGIDWPRDGDGKRPLPQPPLGINHQYGILALVTLANKTPDLTDKRLVFPPLINCFDKNGDFFQGSLGIGVNPPLAKLHVVGTPEPKKGTVAVKSGSLQVLGDSQTKFQQEVHPGGKITLTEGAKTETQTVETVGGDHSLQVKQAFKSDFEKATLTYQQPAILRGDVLTDENGKLKYLPQFLLDSQGNVGIGTSDPGAKLHVNGVFKLGTAQDYLQVQQVADQITFETTRSQYQFDKTIRVKTGVISAGFAPDAQPLSLRTSDIERMAVSKEGNVSMNAPSQGTTLKVLGKAAIGKATVINATPDPTPENGLLVDGNVLANSTLQVLGKAAIGKTADITKAPENGLLVNGTLQASTVLQVLGKAAIGQGADIASTADNSLVVSGSIHAQTNLGINIVPAAIAPTTRLHVNGTVQIGDTTNFVTLTPPTPTNKKVSFATRTADSSYTFDQGITLLKGNLEVNTGSATIAGGATISSGDLTVTKGKLDVKEGPTTIAGGLTVSSGSFTLGSGTAQVLINETELALGTGAISSPTQRLVLKTGNQERLTVLTDGRVGINTADPQKPPTSTLSVSGQAAIGQKFSVNAPAAPTNGLIVEGRLGIGTPNPFAKVEIESAPAFEPVALNVKTGQISRLLVENDGDVIVGQRLLINPLNSLPDSVKNDAEVRLYVQGKVFGNDVVANQFRVFSSRTLKQNIVELSSHEVDEVLRGLNPVRFSYSNDPNQTLHLGFIAEEVPTVVASPDRQTISPVDIVAALTRAVKDHRAAIVSLNKLVKDQQAAIVALTEKVNALENRQN
ncbi:tail fiber domain-containing protein [Kovacikia minuta CCNUW1]|uniref:DUF6519 domain-containing protein n=1 Tax=Kovacikia minuta TaxID=2931930 RepID=UPI001CCAB1D3|nr:DUF6519 domain-containing protein [Kovacikia minuta]UBF28581.1 tail fiber domain-containing protein [Kovacikia minuta CCNUW1]